MSRWLDRYQAVGLPGLLPDRPRPGRPIHITAADEAGIIARTLETAPPSRTHWSTRRMARVAGLHHATIARTSEAHGLKPHRVARSTLSHDPQFVAKLRDVVGLYLDPLERAVVFAVDAKSRIQALDLTRLGLPVKNGRAGIMRHEYKRHGSTTRCAALDVATFAIRQDCIPPRRDQEFLALLRQIVRSVPPNLDIHAILETSVTYKHVAVQWWLARHRRVHFHFTPTPASWLRLVERSVSELTEHQIRRLAVTSVSELITTVTQYIDQQNAAPTPFAWTATIRLLLTTVGEANATLATRHQRRQQPLGGWCRSRCDVIHHAKSYRIG